MLKKLIHASMAVTMLVGVSAATVQPAEARGGRTAAGIAAGIIGLGLLGAYASSRDHGCYLGRRECYRADPHCFYNRYGDYVCRGGRYICERRRICD